jgi:AraC-like DNA-binding protein
LEGLWTLHAYSYEGELQVAGRTLPIQPGAIGIVAPNEDVEYRYKGRSEHLYVHFVMPVVMGKTELPMITLPGAGPDPARFASDLREALPWFPHQTRRADARLWDLLWRLAKETPREDGATGNISPAVREALSLIERGLTEGVRVSEIARSVDLSPGHLTRLFRAATGKTVVVVLQERRVERARHLLTYSDLPVKDIAARVGIEDLNQFNKMMRRHCGASPARFGELGVRD